MVEGVCLVYQFQLFTQCYFRFSVLAAKNINFGFESRLTNLCWHFNMIA